MATPDTSPIFFVRGTIPPPRPRPRKVTNSEKTSTTNNLSQHKYLKLKRQTQQDTDNKFITTRDTDIQNQSVRSMTAPDIGQKGVPAASYNLQHQYKLVSGWESQWHALYHHFTSYHQQRYLSSYHNSKTATSHLKSSDLPKLLTSTRLSPQVTANQQNFTLCNSQHHPQSSSTDEENPLCHDQSLDIAPDNYDSCTLQGLPMTCTESLLVSTINMPSNGRAASNSTATADPIRTSWYNEYLRATLQRMHVRTLKERKKTRSAPGGSVSTLTKDSKQRPELFSSTITYFSQRDVKRSPRERGAVDFDALKAEKTKEVLSKPPPLFKPVPKPRSHWYEMRTPEFHIEARRHNNLVRKSCNW